MRSTSDGDKIYEVKRHALQVEGNFEVSGVEAEDVLAAFSWQTLIGRCPRATEEEAFLKSAPQPCSLFR